MRERERRGLVSLSTLDRSGTDRLTSREQQERHMNAPTAPELLDEVRTVLANRGAGGRIVDVLTGHNLLYVEVETADGTREAAVVYRPEGEPPAAIGRDALAVAADAATPSADRPLRAVGIGALNALSRPFVNWRSGDPMAPSTESVDVIAMVGLFGPVLRSFDDVEVRVFERNPNEVSLPEGLPGGVEVTLHSPESASDVVSDADILYVTGSTLLFGGIERYLDASPPGQLVVLVGATASFHPEPAFEAGVSVVAGGAIRDRPSVRDVIAGTNCQVDLHETGLEKVYAVREGADLSMLGLD
jgi:uncharacterized protein (DUF4213/DUF364 family)